MKPMMFNVTSFGTDVDAAFESAREIAALFDDERAALAVKERYAVIQPPATAWTDNLKRRHALRMLKQHDPRVARLGPCCGAIQLDSQCGMQVWLFFGWARVHPTVLEAR